MQKRRASRLEADSHFTLSGRLLYPKIGSAGVAHVLRTRTASRMRTFILALDVDESTSLRLATGAHYGAVYRCYYHRMDLFIVTSL